ncbi:MAG: PEP/pyruvate-binding domain-containing protein, partial [Eubacteriales bacterium]|nr:PEP/pyruvate-binding domain-containing protein [Eubacteriales bacterium]
MAGNFVYSFNEGSKDMRALLGGKGADLAEMTKIGLPVPFGFTVTTEACRDYYRQGRKLSDEIVIDIENKLHELEAVTGKRFGDQSAPLLVSVRSGAPVSMPGMMDSILDLGMNDRIARALAELTGNRRFAFDSYRRFIEMYGNVVLNIPEADFREILSAVVGVKGCGTEAGLEAGDLEAIVSEYKELILAETGKPLPDDPQDQLIGAIESVLDSWTSDRAVLYRKINNISDDLGTAVNVQAMVYGNMGDRSGSGVAFSRSPVNGDKNIYGEFLLNSQGQDVVSGSRTPERITEMAEQLPDAYKSFVKICEVLE